MEDSNEPWRNRVPHWLFLSICFSFIEQINSCVMGVFSSILKAKEFAFHFRLHFLWIVFQNCLLVQRHWQRTDAAGVCHHYGNNFNCANVIENRTTKFPSSTNKTIYSFNTTMTLLGRWGEINYMARLRRALKAEGLAPEVVQGDGSTLDDKLLPGRTGKR